MDEGRCNRDEGRQITTERQIIDENFGWCQIIAYICSRNANVNRNSLFLAADCHANGQLTTLGGSANDTWQVYLY